MARLNLLLIGTVLFLDVVSVGARCTDKPITCGHALAMDGYLDDTIIALNKLMKSSLDKRRVNYALAVIHEQRGDIDAAIAAYRETLERGIADAYFYLGVLLGKKAEKNSSATSLKQARDLVEDLEHGDANYWLAAVLEDLGESAAALSAYKNIYQDAHRFSPGLRYGHSKLGDEMKQSRSALGARLNIIDIANRVGLMLSSRGYHARAVLELKTALHQDTDNVRTLKTLGLTYEKSGDFKRSMEAFKEAIRLQPGDLEARATLASALDSNGNANRLHGHFDDGMAQWKAGNRDAAVAAFEASAKSGLYAGAPSPFHARKGTATVQGARKDFQTILLGSPDEAEAHLFVANILSDHGHSLDAIEEYKATVRLRPNYLQAQFNLGNEWAREKNWEAAAQHFRTAVELGPNDSDTHILLISVLLKMDTTSALNEALSVAETAVHFLPENPDLRFHLGYVYLRFARREEAAQEFRAYLRLAPSASDGRKEYVNRLLDEMSPYLSP